VPEPEQREDIPLERTLKMKVTFKTERLEIEVEGKDIKAVFDEMAQAQEVMLNTTCGSCDSQNVVMSLRTVQSNTYRSFHCRDCGCELNLGQRKVDGALYPRKKDTKTQEWLPNNGWVKWNGSVQTDDQDDPFSKPARR
jgi:hypothetical protein